MHEITVYPSPLPRTTFVAPRTANVRVGDVVLVKPEHTAAAPGEPQLVALIEATHLQDGAPEHSGISGVLNILGKFDGTHTLPAPSRVNYFKGEAASAPLQVASELFGTVTPVRDPVSKHEIMPAALDVGTWFINPTVKVALSSAGLNRHTVIVAQSGSGKSYAIGVLLEEILRKTSLRLVVIDTNGDYSRSFDAIGARSPVTRGRWDSHAVAVAASRDPSIYERAIKRMISGSSCILDLNRLDRALWAGVLHDLFGQLWLNRSRRTPTLILIDEAHNFASERPGGDSEPVAAEIIRLAAEGRKYGLWMIVASQRPQKLHSNLISQCDNLIAMRLSSRYDLEHVASSFTGASREMIDLARGFPRGTALVTGGLVRCPTLLRFRERTTPEGGGDIELSWTRRYPPP
jgi:Helicase HerA, central domain